MEPQSVVLMKILLNRYGKGSAEIALKCLPEDIIKDVAKMTIMSTDPIPLLECRHKALYKMHYSWLIPPIQKLPSEIYPILLSCLSPHQSSRLQVFFKLNEEVKPLSPLIKNYIFNSLCHLIIGHTNVLPVEYLPETALSPLGNWNKTDLVELIEFLGIHDLSEEMRRIVDKKILKNAYNCLSLKEQQYLRICMHLKEKVTTPHLGLDKWNGEEEKLKSVLQTRGLVRLGKALSGDHPDLIWHLVHTLDTGRGQALLKYYSKKAIPGITAALFQQVTNLMNFLKNKSKL